MKNELRRFLLFLGFILIVGSSHAKIYYVSSSTGNDAYSGTSSELPWKTLDKVNSQTFLPGDQILFKRGDTWTGTVTIKNSGTSGTPIVYDAYGVGNKPILKGSTPVTGWTQHSGNIWKATLATRTNQVFVDGVKMEISASTNLGIAATSWLKIDRNVSTYTFIDAALIGTDWTGAYLHFRTSNWNLRSRKVTACNPATGEITVNGGIIPVTLAAGLGYFITNHLSLVDAAGQWSLDEGTNTLYVWTPTGDSPSAHTVEASTVEDGFIGTRIKYVTIKNLDIKNFNRKGINIYGVNGISGFSDNVLIDNCNLTDNYLVGINIGCFETTGTGMSYEGASNSQVTNCTVSGTSGIGISTWSGDQNAGTVSGNTVSNIGLYSDLGLDGIGQGVAGAGEAMHLWSKNGTISNNIIQNVCYNGITFKSTGTLIENNAISSCELHLHDGGGIYTYGIRTGAIVRNNIVHDMGASDGYEDYGIYFDNETSGVLLENNTVYNCLHGFGIFLHDCHDNSVIGNTVYNCQTAFYTNDLGNLDNNYVANNTFFGLTTSQKTVNWGVSTWNGTDYIVSGNGYFNAQNLASIQCNADYYAPEWFADFSGETGIKGNNTLINNYTVDSILTSNLITNPAFDSDVSGWSVAGVSAVWNNTHLDNGCMQLPIHTLGYTNFNKAVFEENATSSVYKISYDVITDGEHMYGTLSLGGKSAGGFIADGNRRHYEHFVSVDSHSSFWTSFQVFGTVGSLVYFDNFELYRVDATYTAPTEKSKLFVNDTKAVKSFALSGTYKDLDGNVVTSSISLQPFTSRILIKQDVTVLPNQKPVIKGQSFNIEDIKQSGDFIGQVVASDPDAGQSLSYLITAGNSGNLFSLNSATGELTAKANIQFSKDTTVVLTVRVTDNASAPLSAEASVTVTIKATQVADTSVPTISSFSIPSSSSSFTVPVTNFVATDNTGITAYILTESSNPPVAGIGTWSGTAPSSYTFSDYGTHTLYAWAADAAGNVSASAFATVSIINLTPVYVTEDVTICEGESYLNLSIAGQYERTLTASSGADSIVTTNLFVNPVYSITENVTIKEGENYLGWTSSDTYFRTFTSVSGCDSVITTNLTVLMTIHTVEDVTICEGESYMGLTNTGQYERTLLAVNGADSIVTTNLTVNPVYHVSESISIAADENYLGWTISGQYERTLTSVSGCDSIVTSYLTVAQQDVFTLENISICEGESYLEWTTSGEYERILKSAGGADSIVTTNLYVNPVYSITEEVNIVEGDSYMGWELPGTYMRTLTSESGCDSTVSTKLTVVYTTTTIEEVSICEGESYFGWTVSGIYERTLQSSLGLDSVVTTSLVVNPMYAVTEDVSINEGESYLGWTVDGTYTRTLVSLSGCDSVVTTNLTVLHPVYSTEEVTICEGESYLGLSIAGEYERTLTSAAGTDSIVTLILTVNPSYQLIENVSINEGESYLGWSVAGQYERTLTSISGCDSIITTNLSVIPLITASSTEIQDIGLTRKWNIFSSYVVPDQANMKDVLKDLTQSGTLVQVIDEDGSTFEQAANGDWINNIGDFSAAEGYQILLAGDFNLQIAGEKVALPFELQLKQGWNIISFPYTENVNAMEVIQPLINQGVLIKVQNEKGRSIEYWDNRKIWIDRIGTFSPGEGYLVNVTKDCSFSILESYTKGSMLVGEENLSYFELAYSGNGHNHMNLYIDLSQSDLVAGDEVAVFDGEICVGAVKLSENDIFNQTASLVASLIDEGENNGFTNGNPIVLKARLSALDNEISTAPTVLSGAMQFSEGASTFLLLPKELALGLDDITLSSVEMYPNPATEFITLQFSELPSSDTKVQISDMAGKTVYVKPVESDREKISVLSFQSGIYLVNVTDGNTTEHFKLVKR